MKDYKVPKWLKSGHVQTAWNVVFPPKNNLYSNYYFETILLPLDDGTGDSLFLCYHPWQHNKVSEENLNKNAILVLFHGMEGDMDSHYLVTLAESALRRGYSVLRINLRSCGDGWKYSYHPYHAGLTKDLQAIENFISSTWKKKIIFVGYSLSANMVIKYLGSRKDSKIHCFGAVSPPLDLKKVCEHIDEPAQRFYRNRFLASMKEKIKNGRYLISPLTAKQGIASKTMFDFDDFITATVNGFKSALDYYKQSSCIHYIDFIEKEGIIVHAKDDPIVPAEDFSRYNWNTKPNIKVLLTDSGGHVGFMGEKTEEIPDRRWLNKTLLDYFDVKIKA